MDTMKAVRIHEYGDPSVLRYEEAPRPTIREGEVLIRIEAAAVNPIDWKTRYGFLSQWFSHSLPLILGWDVSGVVEAVGDSVTQCAVGDDVFSLADPARDGAYAGYIAVRAADVAPKPPALDHLEAAAIPLAGLAAWQALFDFGGLAQGQTVLIHAAAGGVGTFAVQLAKCRGTRVVGTASENHLGFLYGLGVDEAIDYNRVRFDEAVRDVDVVLDAVGGETQHRSWNVLKPGGVLVSVVDPPSAEAAAEHGVRQAFVATQSNASQLTELGRLVSAGALKPVVSAVLPLQDAQQAHTLSETRHTRGKIVLRINGKG